jgi:tRNA pseudouridine32 synthase/23S rRNA pseudouridine746 synthase
MLDPLVSAAGLPPILFRDRWIVAFDKPAGLLSVPGIGPDKQDCLAHRAASAIAGARIVHRLDRDTSGVIVMALDAETHRALSRQFEERATEKRYEALGAGRPLETAGTIDLPLRKGAIGSAIQIVDHALGRPATTHWSVVSGSDTEGRPWTRFELRPVTGRSHQLRVHLLELGHPILGDNLYAPPEVVAMSDRLCLHATSLAITHPVTGERLVFQSPAPF